MVNFKIAYTVGAMTCFFGSMPAFSSHHLIQQDQRNGQEEIIQRSQVAVPACFSSVPTLPHVTLDPRTTAIIREVSERGNLTDLFLEVKTGGVQTHYSNTFSAGMDKHDATYEDTSTSTTQSNKSREKSSLNLGVSNVSLNAKGGAKSSSSSTSTQMGIHETEYDLKRQMTENPQAIQTITPSSFTLKIRCTPKASQTDLPSTLVYRDPALDEFNALVNRPSLPSSSLHQPSSFSSGSSSMPQYQGSEFDELAEFNAFVNRNRLPLPSSSAPSRFSSQSIQEDF